jgi:dTDP-4-dehydrorhamnose 3,5-epimerase
MVLSKKALKLSLEDVIERNLDSYCDYRGEIYTVCNNKDSELKFSHDKVAIRYKDVLVGIHGDYKTWKLVTCLYGRIFAVIVDNREDSVDYLKFKDFILSHENKKQLLIPPGFGNSFFVLSDVCIYNYKLSYDGEYVDHDQQFTIKWNDPRLGIKWPHDAPILSPRDCE